jgi:hypothetical protein
MLSSRNGDRDRRSRGFALPLPDPATVGCAVRTMAPTESLAAAINRSLSRCARRTLRQWSGTSIMPYQSKVLVEITITSPVGALSGNHRLTCQLPKQ